MTRWRSALDLADDPRPHVAGTGDRVGLEHLGDRREMRGDRVVAGALADLEGQERHHREAERLRGEVRAPAGHDPGRGQSVEPGLHRAAGHTEATARLQDADARLRGEEFDHM